MNKSRRDILAAGVASITALLSGRSSASGETIKVLTKQGKVLEIPKSKIKVKRKAGKDEIDNWMSNKRI